jgi:hypothetical protein
MALLDSELHPALWYFVPVFVTYTVWSFVWVKTAAVLNTTARTTMPETSLRTMVVTTPSGG